MKKSKAKELEILIQQKYESNRLSIDINRHLYEGLLKIVESLKESKPLGIISDHPIKWTSFNCSGSTYLPPFPKGKSKKEQIEIFKKREHHLRNECYNLDNDVRRLKIQNETTKEKNLALSVIIALLLIVIGFMLYNTMTLTCEDLIN